jgi:hypothetical protein
MKDGVLAPIIAQRPPFHVRAGDSVPSLIGASVPRPIGESTLEGGRRAGFIWG